MGESLVTVILMGVLRLVGGAPTPVELFGDHELKLLPVGKFVDLLILFFPNSKTGPLGLTLLGMIGAGTVLGVLYAVVAHVMLPASGYRPKRREWLTAATLAVLMTLVAVVLFWGELAQNFFALPGLSRAAAQGACSQCSGRGTGAATATGACRRCRFERRRWCRDTRVGS